MRLATAYNVSNRNDMLWAESHDHSPANEEEIYVGLIFLHMDSPVLSHGARSGTEHLVSSSDD